jgi:hypothetical protein
MDLPKADDLQSLIAALAPGLIILGIRQWFIAGPPPTLQERAIAYAAVSAVYYAVVNPIAAFLKAEMGTPPWIVDASTYVLAPAILGVLAAAGTKSDVVARLFSRIGLQPVHHIPTAWDYSFSRLNSGTFILVTLSNGSQVGGLYGGASFASSSSAERDILIEEVWEIGDGEWTQPATPRSILLCGRDVRTVEIMRPQ